MRVVADMQAERNRQIMQSIDYASTIQRAMLRTSRQTLAATLPDAALVWEPRDAGGRRLLSLRGVRRRLVPRWPTAPAMACRARS